jgi:hypothetical protein
MTDQDDVDEVFASIVECDVLLDDVIVNLRAAGIKVEPEQRVVVSRWLDMFSADSPIPIGCRLSMLRGMLRA